MARRPQINRRQGSNSRLRHPLTSLQKRVLYLRIDQELSFAQIGRRIGRTKATVYQHFLYGVAKSKLQTGKAATVMEATHERARAQR